ncbi:MAG: hypothetical protein AAGD86_01865 [Pseudomonadota bacterium]
MAMDKKAETFELLRDILRRWERATELVTDDPTTYYLNTHHIMPNKQPLYFGSVAIKKRYVAFHLMPVYVNPDLLADVSPALKKRMQGKSCFNFTQPDDALFEELAALTERGFDDYVRQGYIKQ